MGGGIAFHNSSISLTECFPMPKTEGDIIDLLRTHSAGYDTKAYIEEVGNGIIPGRAKAMITLNMNAAVCRTALACFGVSVIKVKPRTWQEPLGLGKRRDCATDTIWKNKLLAEAQRRFPTLSITKQTADALLILDWAMKR